MRYYIENKNLKVEIDSLGAEIKSVLKKDGYREYMWYGNGKYWGRTSPVLFPFVGSLKDKTYTFQDQSYSMGQHGFARDMEFTFVDSAMDESSNEAQISFLLESNEATRAKYPFDFQLLISYLLKESTVTVSWKVINPADKDMYFSIGAHPAFLCPLHGEESKEGYRLYFEGVDEIHHHGNTLDTGLAKTEEHLVLPLSNHRAVITKKFFDRCTYMIEGKQTGKVCLEEPNGTPIVEMTFDAPLFALWSPEGKNAPFLCIEPWYGRCDAVDFNGSLEKRAYTNHLSAGASFQASYDMRFF